MEKKNNKQLGHNRETRVNPGTKQKEGGRRSSKVKRKMSACEKQLYKGNKFNFCMTVIGVLLNAIMFISLAFMLQFFLEAVEYGNKQLLIKGGAVMGIFLAAYGIASIFERKYKNAFMRRALGQFKDYIFEKMLGKSISQYESGMSSQFISAFSNDLNSIELNYLNGTIELILTIVTYVGAAAVMAIWSPVLGIPIIIISLIFVGLSLKYGERLVEKESETSEENTGFVAQVKDLLNGFIVIKSFKAEREALKIFNARNAELEETKQGRRMTADMVNILGDISSIVINLLIFSLGFWMAYTGKMSLGMVIGFIQLGNYIVSPIKILASRLSNRRAALGLIEKIEEVINEKTEMIEGNDLEEFERDIVFSNVDFAYDDKEVLKNISMRFEKGKSYAIVGGSGSGKSTLLKLMLGHNTQFGGDIRIDGVSVRDIHTDSLYDRISLVQQDVFLFDNSIKDNITMFKEFSPEKVQGAVEKAGLASLLVDKGEDYSCGEGGKNLSGGEKQRVSIARCLVRETPVLLMDEATAALDNETAAQVENAILDISNLTRIVVTHRFNEGSLRKYDEIMVMGRGCMIEQGSFEELMSKKGYFYSLYNVSKEEECA